MTPVEVLRRAYAGGLSISIAPSGNLRYAPTNRMTPELRALLLAHKPALLAFLIEARVTAAELIEAAMRACDYYSDGPEARQAMVDDVLALPEHLHADLLAYLRQQYGKKETQRP